MELSAAAGLQSLPAYATLTSGLAQPNILPWFDWTGQQPNHGNGPIPAFHAPALWTTQFAPAGFSSLSAPFQFYCPPPVLPVAASATNLNLKTHSQLAGLVCAPKDNTEATNSAQVKEEIISASARAAISASETPRSQTTSDQLLQVIVKSPNKRASSPAQHASAAKQDGGDSSDGNVRTVRREMLADPPMHHRSSYADAPSMRKTGSIADLAAAAAHVQGATSANSLDSDQRPDEELDERELKKRRRMMSNRESARRSRLRKLAENEQLARSVKDLISDNMSMKASVETLKATVEALMADKVALVQQVRQLGGKPVCDAVPLATPSSNEFVGRVLVPHILPTAGAATAGAATALPAEPAGQPTQQ
mmetsp:Transcript_6781/g.14995  ORF Transcript_6781/g.14995 Transcript_6781/m.14995 type:complete len:366 (+) Transcript_6781:158-1255(+)|eukprot:CAMPEP_0202911982 /NCGR_PEP_ID=MMETSP1392-20130828/56480_1 /ASSEMBLY_ACC=CAM_ASM_000868 /TAXON_ID=225041 /ORGANISM="Chlamydomonas chlamydogama, Strain SAG 11-48b" /LENGTH=365 /DNA_ID=CAMNT_0049602717 /DNA_START=126 /DNA_END=1223 /DNA_ORIENTATION=+